MNTAASCHMFALKAAAAAKDEYEVDEDAIDDAAVAEAIARAADH